MKRTLRLWMLGLLALAGCREPAPSEAKPAAHVERRGEPHEADAWTLKISPEARAALGIETDSVIAASSEQTRVVGGFVTNPIGGSVAITAPFAGELHAGDAPLVAGMHVDLGDVLLRLTPFAPVDRDLRAQAHRQRATTRARLELAETRVDRTRKLLDGRAASQRTLDEALAELATAKGEDEGALARERAFQRSPLDADVTLTIRAPRSGLLRNVNASPEQSVAGSAALFEIVADDRLWLRVPIHAGDLDRVAPARAVRVARLGGEFGSIEAAPILAPPSADPLAASVDLWFELSAASFDHPGERVLVELPYRGQDSVTSVPSSALVFDVEGGTWVWECLADDGFRRRRVEVIRRVGDRSTLKRGPAIGTCVVRVGALELLGAEFGVQH